MLSSALHFFKRLSADTKPKPIDLKDYPLFQLQQAFEAKEFDAKTVLTILRNEKFTLNCPTIENIHLLPLWVNVMCNHQSKLYELAILMLGCEQPKELAMQPEIAAAKDPAAFCDACKNYLIFTRNFNKPLNTIVQSSMKHIFKYFTVYCDLNYYDYVKRGCTNIIKIIKTIGKNDLTHYTEKSTNLVELLTSLKNGKEKDIADELQLVLDAIESQPAVVSLCMDNISPPWQEDIRCSYFDKAYNLRKKLLVQPLDLCISYFSDSKRTFPIDENAIKSALAQLITQTTSVYEVIQKHDEIAANDKTLKIFLEVMKTATSVLLESQINNFVITTINFLFNQSKSETDQTKKALLEARIIDLIPQARVECFLSPGYPNRNDPPLFTSKLQPFCYSSATLTAMLTALNNSKADLTRITITCEGSKRSLLEHLCKEHKGITDVQLQQHITLLIHAGINPTADLAAGKIPAQYVAFIKATFDHYHNGVMTEVASFIHRDPAGIALSHFFQPAARDSSSPSPSASPSPP